MIHRICHLLVSYFDLVSIGESTACESWPRHCEGSFLRTDGLMFRLWSLGVSRGFFVSWFWFLPNSPFDGSRRRPTGYAWTAFGCHGAHIHRRSHGDGLHQDQRAREGKFLRKRVIGVGFFLSSCGLNLQLRYAYVVSEDPNSLQIRVHASSTWLWFVRRFAVGKWNLISFLRKKNPSLSC
jgi:hypothetical protein